MSDPYEHDVTDPRLEDLLFAYAEDKIGEDELADLETLIGRGGEASSEYWRQIDLHMRLQRSFDEGSSSFPPEAPQTLRTHEKSLSHDNQGQSPHTPINRALLSRFQKTRLHSRLQTLSSIFSTPRRCHSRYLFELFIERSFS